VNATRRPWSAWSAPLAARWRALSARDRRAALIAGGALLLLVAWWVALQPALRALREAPAQIDRLDAQLQQMQRLAAEGRQLQATPRLTTEQSTAALQAATSRLGPRARVVIAGGRATLTLSGVNGAELRDWLAEVRSGARARPQEVQLSRGPQGYSGSIVVALGGDR
jgi:general secretion pathway protein M